MGLSSKQVSIDDAAWKIEVSESPTVKRKQQQQQQSEPLKCPRCDSVNTKFCYYNNYNKSQPRHFCRTCKRHWTSGGTLRNVPVGGGGRKNKRLKTYDVATKATVFGGKSSVNSLFPLGGEKNMSDAPIGPPSSIQESFFSSSSSFNCSKSSYGDNGIFMGSSLSLPLNQDLQFPFSSLSSYESNPDSISSFMQPSNLYYFNGLEETVINCLDTTMSCGSVSDHPWRTPSVIDMLTSNWGWDDIDKFVSYDPTISSNDTKPEP
ncbi:hypothetical protein Nepgr_028771 [Nepenthes gracilis]|uniref:Dof zinc finger protein n=1 Tax=Nepenthes gracilis TaxID=150966 RepID=A0AAD3TBC7_NEPGR|nr:hypothetical protein Nepgr_028771 [Nepenthes gracilis]